MCRTPLWKDTIIDWCSNIDRYASPIKVVIDEISDTCPSELCLFLASNNLAIEVPPFYHVCDMIQYIKKQPISNTYVINMTLAMQIYMRKNANYFRLSGLDSLSDLFETHSMLHNRQIILFTSCKLPDTVMDNWDVWIMKDDMTLLKY